jgi:copper chaperone CopZ
MLRWITPAALLLIALGTVPADALADSPGAAAASKPKPLKLATGEVAIYVGDMHCATCAKKIAGKLYRLKGVVKVRTDVKANLAVVTPQKKKQIDAKAAWAAVQSAGFSPSKLIGPQGTFVPNEKTKGPQLATEAEAPTEAAAKPSVERS